MGPDFLCWLLAGFDQDLLDMSKGGSGEEPLDEHNVLGGVKSTHRNMLRQLFTFSPEPTFDI